MHDDILKDLDIKKIKEFTNIRYPFLMIDKVDEVIPGFSSKGYKSVTINEFYFQGHFPDNPLMPGMIQMESLIQMLSMTILTIRGNEGKNVRCKSADKIRLKERVLPGSILNIEAELKEWDGDKGRGVAKGYVNGREACSAEFYLTMDSHS